MQNFYSLVVMAGFATTLAYVVIDQANTPTFSSPKTIYSTPDTLVQIRLQTTPKRADPNQFYGDTLRAILIDQAR